MKKKILTLGLLVCLAATAVIGGTLAYFTDRDNEVNEFTVGKIDIDLVERFTSSDAKLIPGIEINKDVKIVLEEDSEDTYVWYEYLIPAALDEDATRTDANNIVHVVNTDDADWKYEEPGKIGQETVDGILYNKYVALYTEKLTKENPETGYGMDAVYLDPKVDYDPVGQKVGAVTYHYFYYVMDGGNKVKKFIEHDFSKNIDIIVRAHGIQAAGFDTALKAYEAYQAQ